MDISTMGFIASILVIIPQLVVYFSHICIFLMSSRRKPNQGIDIDRDTPRDISFIIPVKREPVDYIVDAVKYIKSLDIDDYEVLIISDDDEESKKELFHVMSKLREEGYNVWLIWRSEPRGYRTGAINTGLFASRCRYIYVMDVDSRPEKRFLQRAFNVLKSDPRIIAVVGRWEPLNTDSKISEALSLGLRFLTKILYKARSSLGLFTYPLGTGTLYDSNVLKNSLNGWDEERIQDDMELGTRIMYSGFKVLYLDDYVVYVENPSTYRAFRIQQSRWAYGALDTAISRARYIFKSRYPLVVRIEAFLYLLQYIPQTSVFTGITLLTLISLIKPGEYVSALLVFAWITLLVMYTGLMYYSTGVNTPMWNFLIQCSRLSAISTAASLYIAINTYKSLLRIREEYKRTPKGIYQRQYTYLRIPCEFIAGIVIAAAGVYSIVNQAYLTGILLLTISWGFLHVTYSFPSDVFYK